MKKRIVNHKASAPLRFKVEEITDKELKLIDFMITSMPEKSRTSLKQMLRDRFVSVDGKCETLATLNLEAGMEVKIHPHPLPDKIKHPLLNILYQDDEIIVCFKKAGIPTVGTSFEKKITALRILSDHLKKYNPSVKLYMINRLDNDTAGFIIFAKNKDAQAYFSDHWDQIITTQTYRCIIEGKPEFNEGLLLKPVNETEAKTKTPVIIVNKDFQSKGMRKDMNGTASFKVLKSGPYCSLLEIKLLRGRNNQVRKQMKQAKMPICGDKRGGAQLTELDGIALQCTKLELEHPLTHEQMIFFEKTPQWFNKLLSKVPRVKDQKN